MSSKKMQVQLEACRRLEEELIGGEGGSRWGRTSQELREALGILGARDWKSQGGLVVP